MNKRITFLDIFPKRGSYAKNSLSDMEVINLLKDHEEDGMNGELVKHDIYRELEIIEEN